MNKHRELIKAWADGAKIQVKNPCDGFWGDAPHPSWEEDCEYRIKPEEFKWQKEKDHWEKGGEIEYKNQKTGEWITYPFRYSTNSHNSPSLYNWKVYDWRIKPIAILGEETKNSINEILDCMDFEKIKKVMDFLNWTWWNTDGVPEIYELRIFAREQLNRVAKDLIKSGKNRYSTSCGGFVAEAERDDDDSKIYFNLSFVLTNWNNWE